MAELVLEGLTKSYGGRRVLERVGLAVPEGGFTIILGPSGCGKSTLLRLVAGLEQQDAGSIRIGGREVSGLAPKDRDIAMVFQSYALYPHLRVGENLEFPLRMRGAGKAQRRDKAAEAAELLGISELMDRKPKELSGGQRQRVAIGRALVREPALFLFDEPLSNLDAQLRQGMRVELARLHERLGATMVYVTHDQVEAMTLGREIVVLAQGEVQQKGAPREIYARPANLFVAGFIGSPAINLLAGRVEGAGGGPVLACPRAELELELPPAAAGLEGREITLGVRPEDLRPAEEGFAAELELIERIGSESVLHLRRGEARLRTLAAPDFSAEPGSRLALSPRAEAFHYFDDQGRRLEPGGG
jgi:ABC-type sugar transport system ATPase subunit